jgi:hypothetical protein
VRLRQRLAIRFGPADRLPHPSFEDLLYRRVSNRSAARS